MQQPTFDLRKTLRFYTDNPYCNAQIDTYHYAVNSIDAYSVWFFML